jgi:hypothetical protein
LASFAKASARCNFLPEIKHLVLFTFLHILHISNTTRITWYHTCQHQFKVLAMSSDTPATALILVPIAIVASAAFVALKTSHLFNSVSRTIGRFWEAKFPYKSSYKRRKLRRSNLSSSQTYADSWTDLESNAGDDTRVDTFINQTPVRLNNLCGESVPGNLNLFSYSNGSPGLSILRIGGAN